MLGFENVSVFSSALPGFPKFQLNKFSIIAVI
jgi:hypothetical protein